MDAAISKAVKSILAQQKDGNWETTRKPTKPTKDGGPSEEAKWGGETAIATYALLAAGQGFQEPQMEKAIKWLETADLYGTYAVGLRSQVWLLIPEGSRSKDKVVLASRDRDCEWVLASRHHGGSNKGFYGYAYGGESSGSLGASQMPIDPKGPPDNGWIDRSNSQYGVLGAWALEQAGCEIPVAYWVEEDTAWKKAQRSDGGWNYNSGGEDGAPSTTYTMTSAGVATLFITQDYMLRANSHQWDKCNGGVTNSNIERGLAYMDKHIDQALGVRGPWPYYGLYGVERIGVASGRKYFGTVDWFQRGADVLVNSQLGNGSWGTVHDTCFALLFLVRGRAPVMLNKLQYENNPKKLVDPWNERPRDAANLAKWMGHHSVEGFFNWQIVNLRVPVEELHDAPILYLSGSEELALSNQDIDKLRTFVEQGGIILGNADCGSRAFSTSFVKLGNKLFPKYEFRKLPVNHPIFDEQYHAGKWKTKPTVEGLSNGVREMMLLIPDSDLSRAWQTESTKTREEYFQLAGNIFLYSVDKENLHAKGRTHLVHADGPAGRQVRLARIEAGDNWNPEPGAWVRQAAVMHNEQHIDIVPEPVKLGEGKLSAYPIAHLTGTAKVIFTAEQRTDLKDFVTKGGTLIIDSAGGSSEFADSIETELKTIFGAAAGSLDKPLPLTDALYANPKIEKVVYRQYARKSITGSTHDPRIRAIAVNGREAVFYSREDITAGLVGQPVDGVLGYDPKTASQLMTNLVMWGLKPH